MVSASNQSVFFFVQLTDRLFRKIVNSTEIIHAGNEAIEFYRLAYHGIER